MGLRFNAMCIDNGTAYCTTWEDTFLYAINMASGKMDDGVQILDESCFDYALTGNNAAFTGILPYGDSLILIPGKSNEIIRFDKTQRSVLAKCIIPRRKDNIGITGMNFFSGTVYEDSLYLFGYCFPGILALNLNTLQSHVIDEWLQAVSGSFTNFNDGCFHVRYCKLDDKVYLPFMNANAVMIFDLSTERTGIRMVGDESQRYISIEYDGECFWLVPRDATVGSIVRWNPKTDETRQFRDFPNGFDCDISCAFYHSVNLGDRMLLLAHSANMNVSVDFETGNMSEALSFYDASGIQSAKYPFVEFCGDEILLPTQNEFIFWNPVSMVKRVVPYVRSNAWLRREEIISPRIEAYRRELRRRKTLEKMRLPENRGVPFGEGPYATLDDWIRYIVLQEKI